MLLGLYKELYKPTVWLPAVCLCHIDKDVLEEDWFSFNLSSVVLNLNLHLDFYKSAHNMKLHDMT